MRDKNELYEYNRKLIADFLRTGEMVPARTVRLLLEEMEYKEAKSREYQRNLNNELCSLRLKLENKNK